MLFSLSKIAPPRQPRIEDTVLKKSFPGPAFPVREVSLPLEDVAVESGIADLGPPPGNWVLAIPRPTGIAELGAAIPAGVLLGEFIPPN